MTTTTDDSKLLFSTERWVTPEGRVLTTSHREDTGAEWIDYSRVITHHSDTGPISRTYKSDFDNGRESWGVDDWWPKEGEEDD